MSTRKTDELSSLMYPNTASEADIVISPYYLFEEQVTERKLKSVQHNRPKVSAGQDGCILLTACPTASLITDAHSSQSTAFSCRLLIFISGWSFSTSSSHRNLRLPLLLFLFFFFFIPVYSQIFSEMSCPIPFLQHVQSIPNLPFQYQPPCLHLYTAPSMPDQLLLTTFQH